MNSQKGISMSKIKGVSFDLYRTILDTENFHEQSIKEFLNLIGADSIDVGKFHIRWDELFDEEYIYVSSSEFVSLYEISVRSLEVTLREFGLKGDAKLGVDMWRKKYENAKLYPEVEEVMQKIAQRCPIVITSNVDNDDPGYIVVKNKNLPVKAIITSESVRAYKPNKMIFDEALKVLGCEPAEAIHVGDSLVSDVLGAKRAGMIAVYVNRGHIEKRKDELPPPDHVISNLSQIFELGYFD